MIFYLNRLFALELVNQRYYFTDVMMSARTLIQLFRTLNPQMLQKKFRVGEACIYYLKVMVSEGESIVLQLEF